MVVLNNANKAGAAARAAMTLAMGVMAAQRHFRFAAASSSYSSLAASPGLIQSDI